MLVSPLLRNMSTHFPLLLRECVVTASALQGDREGIVPSRSAAVGAKRPGAGPNLYRPAAIGLGLLPFAYPKWPERGMIALAGTPTSEPRRLWSLWDMITVKFAELYADLNTLWLLQHNAEQRAQIARMNSGLGSIGSTGAESSQYIDDATKRMAAGVWKNLLDHTKELEIDPVRDRLIRMGNLLEWKTDWAAFAREVKILQETIEDQLRRKHISMVPNNKVPRLDRYNQLWDDAIKAFENDIEYEINDAEWCYLTDNNTACVFHCMRILEKGLERLCALLSVEYGQDQWLVVIQNIEAKIREMQALKRGQEQTGKLTYFSEAAIHFIFIKDAWRNHVSHARSYYDEHQALSVLTHVSDLMRQLSKELP